MKHYYSICKDVELKELQRFIDTHWSKGHILATHDGLMDFQHKNGNIYNFVLARDENDLLVGVLGFIPVNRYDLRSRDLWLALWKSIDPGAGVGMLDHLVNIFKPASIAAIGINGQVRKLYDAMGYTTGTLTHYLFDGRFNGIIGNALPKKNHSYLIRKYLTHPCRHYEYIVAGNVCYVYRIFNLNGLNFARIFDIFRITQASEHDQHHLDNVDHIDCLCAGIDDEVMIKAGFSIKPSELILPVYTEPVVMENMEVQYAYKSESKEPFVIFKAHGDQDRPNLLTK